MRKICAVLTSICLFACLDTSLAEVQVVAVIPLAESPIEIQDATGRLVSEVEILETKILKEWNYNIGYSRAKTVQIASVIHNSSNSPINDVTISGKVYAWIGKFGTNEESWARVPLRDLDDVNVASIGAIETRAERFAPIQLTELWEPLWREGKWPYRVEVEVNVSCDTCDSVVGRQSRATWTMTPGD